jgi:SnoaL-like domain
MPYKIDPHASWIPLERAAAAETDARRAGLIREVARHMEAEIKGQLEPLMATLTDSPVYHFWGNGPAMVLQGRDAVAGFYSGMFATGRQQFQVVVDKIIANQDNVVTEGQVKQVNRGRDLKAAGITQVGDVPVQDDDLWVSNAQLITVWPADKAGKLIGEDIYFGVNPMQTLTRITAADLPPYYKL